MVSQDSSADMFGWVEAGVPAGRFCCLAGVDDDFFGESVPKLVEVDARENLLGEVLTTLWGYAY